jgi:transposase
MMQIHPQARTTPAVRAEIARSTEPTSVVARRYGISDETVRKWRKRGAQACQDRSSRPKRLPWRVTEEERAIICAVRQATGFPLDDLTFVLRHFLPHLNRDNIYRVLRAEGLNRRPAKPSTLPAKGQGRFREYDLGYVHIDVKHLPKLRTADGEVRKRYLYVAIDRCSRFVHLAVYDAENAANAVALIPGRTQRTPGTGLVYPEKEQLDRSMAEAREALMAWLGRREDRQLGPKQGEEKRSKIKLITVDHTKGFRKPAFV